MKALDSIDWVYVPSFYDFEYDGIHIKSMSAMDGAKKDRQASKARDLDNFRCRRALSTPRAQSCLIPIASRLKEAAREGAGSARPGFCVCPRG